ncbi:hypothetical protein J6590_073152, partial [Homalodisca vitripennis]
KPESNHKKRKRHDEDDCHVYCGVSPYVNFYSALDYVFPKDKLKLSRETTKKRSLHL